MVRFTIAGITNQPTKHRLFAEPEWKGPGGRWASRSLTGCTLCHASTSAQRKNGRLNFVSRLAIPLLSWTTDMDMDPLWSTTAKLDMLPSFTYIVNYLLIIFPWKPGRFKQCFVSGSCERQQGDSASVPRCLGASICSRWSNHRCSLHNSRTGQVVKRDLETAAFLNGTWDQGLESTSWRYGDWWWLYCTDWLYMS